MMRVVTKHIRRHWYKITKGGADKEYMKAFGPMPVPSSSQPPSPRSGARDTHTTPLPSSSQTPSPRSGARSPRSDARDTHTTAAVAARPAAARSSQGLFSSFQDDITDGFWVFVLTADTQHEADEAACLARIRILEHEIAVHISELDHDPVFADTPYYVDDDFDGFPMRKDFPYRGH